MAKAAIFDFDFDHDEFEELGRGYIADFEFRSTKQKTAVALGLKNCWTSDFYFKFPLSCCCSTYCVSVVALLL